MGPNPIPGTNTYYNLSTPQKLPSKTFLKSLDLAPRAAISLLAKDKKAPTSSPIGL